MTWKAIDDSEGLSHYGVLGMKWGVRNAETSRKYSSGNEKRAVKKVKNKSKNDNSKRMKTADHDVEKKQRGAARKIMAAHMGDIALSSLEDMNRYIMAVHMDAITLSSLADMNRDLVETGQQAASFIM